MPVTLNHPTDPTDIVQVFATAVVVLPGKQVMVIAGVDGTKTETSPRRLISVEES